LKRRFWHFSAINQFPAMQSLFSIAVWACFAFSTAIRIVACLLFCLFFCEDSQIEFFNNFRPGLKISISSFSNERSSFIEKDLIETSWITTLLHCLFFSIFWTLLENMSSQIVFFWSRKSAEKSDIVVNIIDWLVKNLMTVAITDWSIFAAVKNLSFIWFLKICKKSNRIELNFFKL